MEKTKVYLADLTHTGNGITALNFPLGTAFVAAYGQKVLGDHFEFRLFKFPEPLSQALISDPPAILACANYSWNLELTYSFCSWAKKRCPNLIVVFGGPNFPVLAQEQQEFLTKRAAVDFCIQNEGELGLVALLEKLQQYDFDTGRLKHNAEEITNCAYLAGDRLVSGKVERIADVNIVPSPYLSGILDEFFELPLIPMIETTRGCPFSCSFCADGRPSKNKVERFETARVREELEYIARRVKNVDEIIITDLNFGMYKQDVEAARYIAEIQEQYHWPVLVKGSAGKNRQERIIETASILKGTWVVGSAIQSSDPEVLKNINRSNISLEAYHKFNEYLHEIDNDAVTYTEIILALPGDSKAKHFESLRYGVDKRINSVRMYQAILLAGTEMATRETRDKYQMLSKFRIMPGGVGVYRFGTESVPVVEIEEIIVGSRDMTLEDYVDCRVMNLLIETYFNNALFDEVFSALRAMDVSVFDFLVYLHEHDELYTPKMHEILASFVQATKDDLYDSHEEAKEYALRSDLFPKYLSGELGSNELLGHKALLYEQLEDILTVMVRAVKSFLREKGLLNEAAEEYFDQIREFTLLRKKQIHKSDLRLEHRFSYDFSAISALNYEVDPRSVAQTNQAVNLRFFHTPGQQDHIRNAIDLYGNHPGGIGRMIQRSNLKKMYRQFERV